MSDTLSGAVTALRHTGGLLGEAAAGLRALDPGPGAFGDGPGRLGELGQDLYRQWQAGLDARTAEARNHAARLNDLADAVARAGAGYAEIDYDAGRRRTPEVR
jgi:hypothetical protein